MNALCAFNCCLEDFSLWPASFHVLVTQTPAQCHAHIITWCNQQADGMQSLSLALLAIILVTVERNKQLNGRNWGKV